MDRLVARHLLPSSAPDYAAHLLTGVLGDLNYVDLAHACGRVRSDDISQFPLCMFQVS